ncbi:MAG: L-threonylcarbamoyladenylate synthase [Pseudomonadales bacterium]|nr:L-threonylcarbamoyladenylate synthase [Pseudomonadales bacterium]
MTPTENAAACLTAGGVIAHATEGVWGLACDPNNEYAVQRIIALKGRDADKGLLLIAGSAQVFAGALSVVEPEVRTRVLASWPGHVTWLLPGDEYPQTIRGKHTTIACRVPDHAQARQIACTFGGCLVSTSLNRAGEPPVMDYRQALATFDNLVDYTVPGEISGYSGPSAIYQLDGSIVRAGGR